MTFRLFRSVPQQESAHEVLLQSLFQLAYALRCFCHNKFLMILLDLTYILKKWKSLQYSSYSKDENYIHTLCMYNLLALKFLSATFLLVCFLSLNESTCQTRKKIFISLQKLFMFSRKSNFRIIHFQISWRHEMSKHKTRNTFHWITSEVNRVC